MTKKTLISALIIGIFVFVTAWAMILSYRITREVNISNKESGSEENANAENIIITETKNGQKFWELYAQTGQYDSTRSNAVLTNIKGYFYNNDKMVLTFSSPQARYSVKNKEIKLLGRPQAVTESKIYISSDEMTWSDVEDKIKAKGNVKIIKMPKFAAKADNAFFSPDFSKIKIIGNTTTYSYKIGK